MLQYAECTPKQINTVYTSYENQARLFQTENETENETWHFSRWSERKIIGSFVNIILPVQSALPTILRYIYKKKKKEVEQVDTSLKRTKRKNMYICLILRECHGIYAYAEAAMVCPCNCSLLRLLAVSCIFLYGMGKVCS